MPTIPIRWSDNTKELAQNLRQGLNQIEATRASAEKLTQSLSGEKLVRAAHNYVAAVQQLGGATKLTASEQARVNDVVTRAIEKYKALGKEAPDAMKELAKATRQAESPLAGLTTRMVALGAAVGTFLGNVAYDAVKRLASGLLEIAANGVKLAPTVGAFQSLTRAVGETADGMLKAGRTATKGLIGDLDLMHAANKGLLLGLPITSQSFGTLAQTAVVLGKAMGQGPVKSFDDLITALGRSSPMILDNLGLSVKVGEANEKYAASVGKTAEQLTDAEKKLAFYNAAMDAAKRKVEEVGGLNLTLADRVQQAQVAIKNFTDALGVAIATSPVMNAAFGAVGDALTNAFGENQSTLVQVLTGYVNSLALALVDLADKGVRAAGFLRKEYIALGKLWGNLAQIVDGVRLSVMLLIQLVGFLSGMKIFDRKGWDDFDEQVQNLEISMLQRGKALKEMDEEQRNVDSSTDKLATSIASLRAQMVAASQTQADSAVIAEQLTRTLDDQGKAAGTNAEAMKKAAEAHKKFLESVQKATEHLGLSTFTLHRFGAVDLPTVTSSMAEAIAATREWLAPLDDATGNVQDLQREGRFLSAALVQVHGQLIKLPSVTSQAADAIAEVREEARETTSVLDGLRAGIESLWQGISGGQGIRGAISNIGRGFIDGIGRLLSGGIASLISGGIALLGKGLGKLFGIDREHERVNDLRDDFIDAAGGLHQLNVAAHGAGLTLDRLLSAKKVKDFQAAVDELNAALQFQDDAMKTLEETVRKYGFSIEELGPAFAAQQLDKKAQELYQDFRVLTSAGIDIDTVLGKMGDSINAFVRDALKTGTEIPAALAPVLQRMVELGMLTDENGNVITDLEAAGVRFSETMTEGFTRVVQEVQKLTEAITRGLGLALDNLPTRRSIDIDVNYHDPGWTPPIDPFAPNAMHGGIVGDGRMLQAFDGGGFVQPRPRVPMLRPPNNVDTQLIWAMPGELLLNESQQGQLAETLQAAAHMASSSHQGAVEVRQPVLIQVVDERGRILKEEFIEDIVHDKRGTRTILQRQLVG